MSSTSVTPDAVIELVEQRLGAAQELPLTLAADIWADRQVAKNPKSQNSEQDGPATKDQKSRYGREKKGNKYVPASPDSDSPDGSSCFLLLSADQRRLPRNLAAVQVQGGESL
jgi:hypothetical protein